MISTALSSVVFILLTFVSGVVLARCLGEVGRGQYGAAYFWAQFLASFGAISFFEAAIVRRRPDEAPETCLSSMLAVSAGLGLACAAVFAGAVATGLVTVEGVSPWMLIAFVGACVGLSLLSRAMATVETMRRNFAMLNFERVFSPFVFTLLVAAVAIFARHDIAIVMAAFLAASLPLFLLRLARFRRNLFAPLKTGFAKDALALGGKFHLAAALTLIATQLDRLIVVSIWPADQLGHYFVALSVAGAGLAAVSQAISMTLLPTLAASEGEVRRDRLERLFRYTIIVTFVFVVLICAAAPVLVPWVYGPRFAPAAVYAQGLCLALAAQPLRTIVLEANRSRGHHGPGVEMAIASLAVFAVVAGVTRLAAPAHLFLALGLSNLAAIAIGLRRPMKNGDMRLASTFAFKPGDLEYLAKQARRYGGEGLRRAQRGIAALTGGRA